MGAMKPVLLLVDDDYLDTLITKRCLKELAVTTPVVCATGGEEAIEYLMANSYELPRAILLDLNMPRMGGFEFLEQINAQEQFRSIPVLILTTSSAQEDIDRSRTLGAVAYIVKSSNIVEFKEGLKCVMRYADVAHDAACGVDSQTDACYLVPQEQ